MKGQAIVHGAISIVNAISTGKGSALGVMLETSAEVTLEPINNQNILHFYSDISQDSTLAEATVTDILKKYGNGNYEITISTKSEIPEGRGLKSSSAASNAIGLATLSALQIKIDDEKIIKMAVKASLSAGVTITGAFDDACASYFGGFVVTDNLNLKLLKKEPAPEDISILIYIPNEQIFTKDFDKKKIMHIKQDISKAFDLSLKGEYWKAMTINGALHSKNLGLNSQYAETALKSGAIAAGLSGTGPAVAAICKKDFIKEIKTSWQQLPGEVKVTSVNNTKAKGLFINYK